MMLVVDHEGGVSRIEPGEAGYIGIDPDLLAAAATTVCDLARSGEPLLLQDDGESEADSYPALIDVTDAFTEATGLRDVDVSPSLVRFGASPEHTKNIAILNYSFHSDAEAGSYTPPNHRQATLSIAADKTGNELPWASTVIAPSLTWGTKVPGGLEDRLTYATGAEEAVVPDVDTVQLDSPGITMFHQSKLHSGVWLPEGAVRYTVIAQLLTE